MVTVDTLCAWAYGRGVGTWREHLPDTIHVNGVICDQPMRALCTVCATVWTQESTEVQAGDNLIAWASEHQRRCPQRLAG